MSDKPAPPLLSTLTEEEGAAALARYRLIQPCLEQGVPLAQAAKHHGLVRRTAQRWVARYQAHGLAGLTRHTRADRGHSRSLRPELKQAIEGLALRKPAPTAAFVHRQVVDLATQHGWPLPSYQGVYKVIKQLDPGLVTLAHAGSKAYRTTFDLLYRREAAHPNAIWQADHTLLDLWMRHDEGHPARPWLTVIMDDYSRAIAGFGVSFHAPSTIQTALVLRQAIWRKPLPQWHILGIPETFYTEYVPRHIFDVMCPSALCGRVAA